MPLYSLILFAVLTFFSFSHSSSHTEKIEIGKESFQTSSDINPTIPAGFVDNLETFPNYFQRDTTFGGFEHGGRVYCGPVAVANALMWFYHKGHHNLIDSRGDSTRDHFELAKILGSSQYFNTGNRGTGARALSSGLERYFHNRDISGFEISHQGWRSVAPHFTQPTKTLPDIQSLKKALREDKAVLLNFGWYRYDQQNDVYRRTGGHWVTLIGYGHDGKGENPNALIFRDPGTRNRLNDYILIEKIEEGEMVGRTQGLPVNAEGFYKFRQSRRRVGIIDGAMVISMPQLHQTEHLARN
ncbi:hypothetical protein CHISP_2073 [Chitinispirillum alkaliphilum]|nr:hypothetical protein CHISP_2073 [Chitinispirillum alkaliphilum]